MKKSFITSGPGRDPNCLFSRAQAHIESNPIRHAWCIVSCKCKDKYIIRYCFSLCKIVITLAGSTLKHQLQSLLYQIMSLSLSLNFHSPLPSRCLISSLKLATSLRRHLNVSID